MRHLIKVLAYVVLVAGVAFVIWLFVFLIHHGIILTPDGETPDTGLTGEIGDFVGGVVGTAFSFVAILFVIVTLMEQNRQNQRNIFVQSYYEMLNVHANHVSQMTLHKSDNEIVCGREVFSLLIKHYDTIYDTIDRYVHNIINGGIQGEPLEKEQVAYLKDDIKRKSLVMRLAFGYFFYGSEYYRFRSYKDKIEKTIEDTILSIGKSNQFYTEGNHVILGHYYRHMFQMIQYVINADYLSEEERYTYAKQLRAQMDDDEQLLLYYDAMSDIGAEWLKTEKCADEITKIRQLSPLARFRMIKNIPASATIKGIQPEIYFNETIKMLKGKGIDFFEQRNLEKLAI